MRFDMVFTAQILMRIFVETTPLSKYLQTKGILSAHRVVIATQESLKSLTGDFSTVKAAADKFVKWTNDCIEEREEDV